jgi:hypothetical protein
VGHADNTITTGSGSGSGSGSGEWDLEQLVEAVNKLPAHSLA